MYDGVECSHVVQEKGPVVGSGDHTMQLQVIQTPINFFTSYVLLDCPQGF